jgi:4-aminobutyrate aminotransferase
LIGAGDKNLHRSKQSIKRLNNTIASSNRAQYYPIVVKKAHGCKVVDIDGKSYLDFNAGWTVAGVGHTNQRVTKAVKKELDKSAGLTAITFPNEITIKFAEELVALTPGNFEKRVWFRHSGSDACAAAFKLVPLKTGKPRILSFFGSMHGTDAGGLAMGGHPAISKYQVSGLVTKIPYAYCYRCPYGLEYPSCGIYCASDFIENNVLKYVSPPEDTSFMIVEPIQSDAGDIVPPVGYFEKLKKTCRRFGINLIVDEVKTGFARTGKILAIEHSSTVVPDGIALGKSIASGIPVGALVARKNLLEGGFALSTLSGNSIGATSGLATLSVIREENLIQNSKKMGDYLLKLLIEIKERHSLIGDVRGKGLLVGVEFVKNQKTKEPARLETAKIVYRAWELGLLTVFVGADSNVMEITPPLIITRDEIDKGANIIERAISDVETGKVADSKVASYIGF